MRPKKTILLVCPNEVTASVLTFNMRVWGYLPTKEHSIEEALQLVKAERFDLALLLPAADATKVGAFEQCALEIDALQQARGARTQIYDTVNVLQQDAALGVPRIPMLSRSAELLREALRLAMIRKRGPRKLTPPVLQPETVEQQAIAQAFERREAQKRRVA